MARIGRFRDDRARQRYLRAYDAMESLWPLPSVRLDLETSFGSTHVRRSGSGAGAPLVLLHGLNGNGLSWYFAAEDLARDREIVALDTLGTAGRSVQTAPFERDADLGSWFAQILDGLGAERVHLLGESMGAWHATLIARHVPERIASLTLVEPNGFVVRPRWRTLMTFVRLSARPTDAGWRKLGRWLTPGVTAPEPAVACAKASMGYRPGIGWARVLPDADLRHLAMPTLAVLGAESVLSEPEAAGRRLTALLPHVEVHTVPAGGHAVHAQYPRRVRPLILDFLARHDRTAAPAAD